MLIKVLIEVLETASVSDYEVHVAYKIMKVTNFKNFTGMK